MKQNIIAVDFDGTLCENKWPEIGMPNEELIEYLKRRQANGEKLILWTSRNEEQTKDAVEWCKDHGLVFDAVNDNLPEIVEAFGGNCRKIFANEYIDDHNRSIGSCREKLSVGLKTRSPLLVVEKSRTGKTENGITVVLAMRVH